MCDACSVKGVNWSITNGPTKSRLEVAKFYTSFESKEVKVRLCYLCAMKLFLEGESVFLNKNKRLYSELEHTNGANSFDW